MDLRPPRSDGDEQEVLLLALGYLRESLLKKVDGVTDEDARQSLVDSGTTLLWLVKHVGAAEHLWLHQRWAGEQGAIDHDVTDADTIASVSAAYRASWPGLD